MPEEENLNAPEAPVVDPAPPVPTDPTTPVERVVEVVSLDFGEAGFVTIKVRDIDSDEVIVKRVAVVEEDFEIIGRNVLTQGEVDALVAKVAEVGDALKTKDDMIKSLDAEIAGLKQTNRLLVAAADAAQGDLARHTATGAPSKLADLPTLDKIPAHKSLEEIHAERPGDGIDGGCRLE